MGVRPSVTREAITIEAVCGAVYPDRWRADLKFFDQKIVSVDG